MNNKNTTLYILAFYILFTLSCKNNSNKAASAAAAPPLPTQVSLWINAFIPTNGSGTIINVNKGPHNGKTAINGPLGVIWCYLTDNRDFSNDPAASRRMQSLVRLNLPALGLLNHTQTCHNTVELNKSDFTVNCDRIAPTTAITVSAVTVTTAGNIKTAKFTLTAGANNPCVTGSPDIDWVLPVTIELNTTTNKVTVKVVNGLVEPFPAFEMYGRVDNLGAKELFRRSPDAASTPWILPGSPNKIVNANVLLN